MTHKMSFHKTKDCNYEHLKFILEYISLVVLKLNSIFFSMSLRVQVFIFNVSQVQIHQDNEV